MAERDQLHAPDLGSHRLLGDGRSAALIRLDGEVDWWCAPDLDSPPLLWGLLDPAGGAARWPGARHVAADPSPAARLLTTVLRIGRTRVECRDGLLAADASGPPALVRLVRALDGPLDVDHEFSAGGFDAPWADWSPTGTAVLPSGTLLVEGGAHTVVGGVLRSRLHAPPRTWVALRIGLASLPVGSATALLDRLIAQEDDLRAEVAAARLPSRHRHRAADALRVLAACTYRPTGAVVASPTTSLPEAVGGDRQFDYRFSWLRDASLAVSVAALLGRPATAAGFLRFICARVADDPLQTPPVLSIRGEPVPAERTVGGVSGWAGSLPVRTGNAAGGQVQADALGLFCEAVSVHLQTGGSLEERVWRVVRGVADGLAAQICSESGPRPGAGIWELREPRPLVGEDIGRWLALDRAIWVGRGWRPLSRRRRWKRARAVVHDRVVAALLPDGGLPQSYDGDPTRPSYDASALMATVFGLLPRDDPRASRLIDVVLRELGTGPHVYRYEPGAPGERARDGFSGREGAFVPMGWWVVAALSRVGRVREAQTRAAQLDAALPRLQSEEVDPLSGGGRGNTPLLWSHMAAARALYLLGAAERRQRWGAAGLALWRLGRFLSLRRASARAA